MNRLATIPFWAWYLFSLTVCYLLWNPSGYSLVGMVSSHEWAASSKAVAVIVMAVVLSLYIVEGRRTLNPFGILLFFAVVGAVLWAVFDHGINGFAGIAWWGHLIIALLLTIAVQGGRVYRSLTGRVAVTQGDDAGSHHH
jgi:hypothetical protein